MRFLLFTLFVFLITPNHANALSCAEPVMTSEVIESAEAIFEGEVLKVKSEKIMDTLKGVIFDDEMDKSAVFIFRVKKAWMGVNKGELVKVRSNTYWGEMFSPGEEYLVVAETVQDGVLNAGLCGLSSLLSHADKSIQFLKQYYAAFPVRDDESN